MINLQYGQHGLLDSVGIRSSSRRVCSVIMNNLSKISLMRTIPLDFTKNFKWNMIGRFRSTTTVIDSQVKVMEGISEGWWDPNGFARALHAYNRIRIPLLCDGLIKTNPALKMNPDDKIIKDVKIMDIGCGGGILAEALAKQGANVYGVDASKELLSIAEEHAKYQNDLNLQYINSTIEEYSKTHKEEFDAIIASEVIEHIYEKELFVEKCLETLKPGGSIFFTTFSKTFWSWFYGIILAENVFGCIPKGAHEFKLFIGSDNLSSMLEKYNCKTVVCKGIHYNPFKNNWYWVNHKLFSYGMQAVKIK